jgi:hypothetical protein
MEEPQVRDSLVREHLPEGFAKNEIGTFLCDGFELLADCPIDSRDLIWRCPRALARQVADPIPRPAQTGNCP